MGAALWVGTENEKVSGGDVVKFSCLTALRDPEVLGLSG